MSVLIVHRSYRYQGGEDLYLEKVLIPQISAMGLKYHALILPALFSKKSLFLNDLFELATMILGLETIRPSYFSVRRVLQSKFDTVIFNNVIPTVSLAVPKLCRERGLRTLMWVHNARLSCANGLLFNGREECSKCSLKGSHWALLQKCHGTWFQSLIYSWVYRFQRVRKCIEPYIDQFVAVSQYASDHLKSKQVTVLRAVLDQVKTPSELPKDFKSLKKPFLLFVGRLSYEKGIDLFLDMARKFPQFGFLALGSGPLENKMKGLAPENVYFGGFSSTATLNWAYSQAHALVIPSRVGENAPMVLMESHYFKTPVIYTAGGGAEEIVHWLGRSGCRLEDFNGQSFSRNGVELSEKQKEFNALFEKTLK